MRILNAYIWIWIKHKTLVECHVSVHALFRILGSTDNVHILPHRNIRPLKRPSVVSSLHRNRIRLRNLKARRKEGGR